MADFLLKMNAFNTFFLKMCIVSNCIHLLSSLIFSLKTTTVNGSTICLANEILEKCIKQLKLEFFYFNFFKNTSTSLNHSPQQTSTNSHKLFSLFQQLYSYTQQQLVFLATLQNLVQNYLYCIFHHTFLEGSN